MSILFHRAGRLLLIIALLVSAGGHWVVLQSVAWTSMLVERSREVAFIEAVKVTFDGSHPCGLCQKIESGREQEKQHDRTLAIAKLELFYEPPLGSLFPPPSVRDFRSESAFGSPRSQAPRVPPPRGC
ncbi:MAG: hypothetical protein ABI680_06705 [Chthoniobacteraceae bacterium]